ncbi:MAG: hypothetical protein J2P31_01870 [Blastocatellia bacterium]|nr:hypothetical protein [Blastocatellia bacterium]
MPKDWVRNVDRYKIRGGQLNEFDYTRQQTELAREQGEQEQSDKIAIPSEQSRANRIKKLLHKYGESVPGEKKKKAASKEAIPKKAGAARKKEIAEPVKKAAKTVKKSTAKAAKTVKKSTAKAVKTIKKSTAIAAARPAAKATSKKAVGKGPVRGKKTTSKPKRGTKGKRA